MGRIDDRMREYEGGPRAGSGFFQNRACPYFPCHCGVSTERFNCLFCYCPLYALGPGCGGDFRYSAQGVKDCSACVRLHDGDGGTVLVKERFGELAALAGTGVPVELGKKGQAAATEVARPSARDGSRCEKEDAPTITTGVGTETGCEDGDRTCDAPEAGDESRTTSANGTRP